MVCAFTQSKNKSARNLVCEQTSFFVHNDNARGSTHEFHLQVPVTDGEIAAAVAILCRADEKWGTTRSTCLLY